jgi:hypothetical protein
MKRSGRPKKFAIQTALRIDPKIGAHGEAISAGEAR